MFLFINTTVSQRVHLSLANKDKVIDRKNVKVGRRQAERLLPLLDKMLKKNKIKLNQLMGIIVVSGPGPFTSVRAGVMLANTLSYSLKVPSVGLKFSTKFNNLEELFHQGIKQLKGKKGFSSIHPFYGKEPNITKPKKLKV